MHTMEKEDFKYAMTSNHAWENSTQNMHTSSGCCPTYDFSLWEQQPLVLTKLTTSGGIKEANEQIQTVQLLMPA